MSDEGYVDKAAKKAAREVAAVEQPSKSKHVKSIPPEGYVCNSCKSHGHWIQQCPQKTKRRKSAHIPVAGIDPSADDIARAKEMQKIPPPNCLCGTKARLAKVKKSTVRDNSPANGVYFFFCSKKKDDSTKCHFAQPVEGSRDPKSKKKQKTAAMSSWDEQADY